MSEDAAFSGPFFTGFDTEDLSDFISIQGGTWYASDGVLHQPVCDDTDLLLKDRTWENLIARVDFTIDQDCGSIIRQLSLHARWSSGEYCSNQRGYTCTVDIYFQEVGIGSFVDQCTGGWVRTTAIPVLASGEWYNLTLSNVDSELVCTLSGQSLGNDIVVSALHSGVASGTVGFSVIGMLARFDNLQVTPQ